MKTRNKFILLMVFYFGTGLIQPALRAQDQWALSDNSCTACAAPRPGDTRVPMLLRDQPFHPLSETALMIPGKIFTAAQEPDTLLPYLKSQPAVINYPPKARKRGWEGEVVLAVEVLATGDVGVAQVMRSSGYNLLDDAAVAAVKDWIFEPAQMRGAPVTTCIQIPVVFQLSSSQGRD